jgi:hypothetical protein
LQSHKDYKIQYKVHLNFDLESQQNNSFFCFIYLLNQNVF